MFYFRNAFFLNQLVSKTCRNNSIDSIDIDVVNHSAESERYNLGLCGCELYGNTGTVQMLVKWENIWENPWATKRVEGEIG